MSNKPAHPAWRGAIYCATHKHYLLSCADYEALWVRSGGRCEICTIPSNQGERGWLKLRIDHDGMFGLYAVRGLLCNDCNTHLEWHPSEGDARARDQYLRNPWWVEYFISIGEPLTVDEPPLGSVVEVGRAQLCRWTRDERGWYCLRETCKNHSYYHRQTAGRRYWRHFQYTFGPRNILVLSE